jgi:hypothetical protein
LLADIFVHKQHSFFYRPRFAVLKPVGVSAQPSNNGGSSFRASYVGFTFKAYDFAHVSS